MVASKVIIGGVLAAGASASAVSPFAAYLAARQDLSPGSPLYNCHDNCGQAILETEDVSDVCSNSIFLTDYENCLQCAGPDNEDIWQYYGSALTAAAAACDLATTPLAGSQADVGTAIPAESGDVTTTAASTPSSAAAASSATLTSSAAGTSSAPAAAGSSSAGAAATSSAAASVGTSSAAAVAGTFSSVAAAGSSSGAAAAGTTSAGSASVAASVTSAAASSAGQSGAASSGVASGTGASSSSNTTSSATSVVTAGASIRSVAVSLVGAAVFGAVCAVAF